MDDVEIIGIYGCYIVKYGIFDGYWFDFCVNIVSGNVSVLYVMCVV